MGRLIVPAHAVNTTELAQRINEARQVAVMGFVIAIPGGAHPIEVRLQQAVPLEAVTGVLVKIAFDELGKLNGEDVAERILGSVNGEHN